MEAEIRVWALIGVVIAGGGIATVLILHAMASLGERVGKADTHGRVAWAIRQLDPPGAGGRPPIHAHVVAAVGVAGSTAPGGSIQHRMVRAPAGV